MCPRHSSVAQRAAVRPPSLVCACLQFCVRLPLRPVPGSLNNAAVFQGYDLGDDVPDDLAGVGDGIVAALAAQQQPGTVTRGAAAAAAVPAAAGRAVAAEVAPRELRDALTFDERWGPTEWGPIPFLPKPDLLVEGMERAWGDLDAYRGLSSTADGNLLVSGVQVCASRVATAGPLLATNGCDHKTPMRTSGAPPVSQRPGPAFFVRSGTEPQSAVMKYT